ncbi:copia-like retroelement pol polyprotein, partial [Tanacetum coccineum]
NNENADKTMDEINEQTGIMKQVQDALAAPMGLNVDFHEDEQEAEIEDSEGVELVFDTMFM